MRHSRTIGLAGAALLGGTLLAGPASAAPARDAVEACRAFDEQGILERAGVTFGECVNLFKGSDSRNAENFIAGLCGLDFALKFTGTTNKGQCIKVVRSVQV